MSPATAAPAAPPGPTAPPNRDLDTYRLFRRLVPAQLIDQRQPSAKQAVYTAFITVWLLIYQRLHGGACRDDAVSALLFTFPREDLPDCKRVRDDNISAGNSGYCKACNRLDLDLACWLADQAFDSLSQSHPPTWKGRRVQLLDGSSFSLAPSENLRLAYPPPTNQFGPSHWPKMLVLVAHDLDSGLACRPEYAAMYGDDADCESGLTLKLLLRLPAHSLLLADGNFGIFLVAHAAVSAGHDVLLRLSGPRFKALLKRARPLGLGRWEVTWRPSAEERKKYGKRLPEGAEVPGYLVAVTVGPEGKEETLYLFTTLREGANQELALLYGRRWRVETDIAAEKVTLGLGQVSGTTAAMVEKEVVLATVAYNLVVQVRRLAAQQAKVEPRRLSFKGTLSLLVAFQAKVAAATLSEEEVQKEFERMLRGAGQRKVANRPGRKYPREVLKRASRYPERKRNKPGPVPATAGTAVPYGDPGQRPGGQGKE